MEQFQHNTKILIKLSKRFQFYLLNTLLLGWAAASQNYKRSELNWFAYCPWRWSGGGGLQLFPSAQSVNIYSVFQHTSNLRIQLFLYQFLHAEQKKQVLKMEVIAFAWHTEPGLHIKPETLFLCQVHGEGKNKWPSQPVIHPIKWLEICPVRTRNQKIK